MSELYVHLYVTLSQSHIKLWYHASRFVAVDPPQVV